MCHNIKVAEALAAMIYAHILWSSDICGTTASWVIMTVRCYMISDYVKIGEKPHLGFIDSCIVFSV